MYLYSGEAKTTKEKYIEFGFLSDYEMGSGFAIDERVRNSISNDLEEGEELDCIVDYTVQKISSDR